MHMRLSELRRRAALIQHAPVEHESSQHPLQESASRLRLLHGTGALVSAILIATTAQAASVLTLCLPAIGDKVATSPTSPANMGGAIDSTLSPVGPIFIDHDETIGEGETNVNVLAQTEDLELLTHTGIDLNVRANTIVVAASHGITSKLDVSVVLPVVQEDVDVHVMGPLEGHTFVKFSGPSDLAVRLKYRLLPWLSALLKATFPTGNPNNGLGTGEYFLSPGLAASTIVGPLQFNGFTSFNVDLSYARKSSISYGVGVSTLLYFPWLGGAVEFLGESGGSPDPLIILGTDYAQNQTFALAFGLRAVLPHGFMIFVAGTYALSHGGLRADGVFPTIGVGGRF